MTPAELFRLQGFTPETIVPLASPIAMGRLAGNAMSIPVLTHLFNALLPLLFDELRDESSSE